MWPALDKKMGRFHELEEMLGDAAIIADPTKFRALSKEHGNLAKLAGPYNEYHRLAAAIKASESLLTEDDAEIQAMATEELSTLRAKQAQIHSDLEDRLLVDDEEDFDSLIMEIRAGTGGDEAALFAGSLYEMYSRYARTRGWKIEEISFSQGEAGGYKEVVLSISGDGVYRDLKYESGGHRVQRVPKTETQGRIHTSAATVAVLPEPDDIAVDINPEDIEIETMRAGGAGGQHVNKTESAVRLWYRKGTPDEVEVKCQDERSQRKNREQAMRVLRSRVYEAQRMKLHKVRADARKSLIGSGDRSERIRTYNFPQNRLTDHRINLTLYALDLIIMGQLDPLFQPLKNFEKQQRLAQV